MKTQHYVILAIAALAVYFLFFRTEDVILDQPDTRGDDLGDGTQTNRDFTIIGRAGTDRPAQGKTVSGGGGGDSQPKQNMPQARVVVPGKKRPITVGGLPATGRWYGYGANGRQAATDAHYNTGCTFVENYGEYGCF